MADGEQSAERGAGERVEWRVEVLDAVRRDPGNPLQLIVAVSDTSVVVAPPTGAGYVVPHQSIERYCDALRAADSVAEHRKKVLRLDPP